MKRIQLPSKPQLRAIKIEPIGSAEQRVYLLWDPSGSGEAVVLPRCGALLATLMNGKRTCAEIREAFCQRTGIAVPREDVRRVIQRLECARMLESAGFRRYFLREVRDYLRNPVRPAAYAGDAYPGRPQALRRCILRFFSEHAKTAGDPRGNRSPRADPAGRVPEKSGPSPRKITALRRAAGKNRRSREVPATGLAGVLAPHIDPLRGSRTYAAAYLPVRRHCTADLFVILGTAHSMLSQWFSLTRKDFDTPLGVVRTDQAFCNRLQKRLSASARGKNLNIFADELAHRREHSLEFQAVFLQFLFGSKRPFRIVPILVSSFQPLIAEGEMPEESAEVHLFVRALQQTLAEYPGRACCISSADLAHIGPRFGDPQPVAEKRLRRQAADDQKLLRHLCRGDRRGFFRHVARQADRNRICGLAPTYLMLQVLGPVRGELLGYEQAVESDGSACVSFAAAAFYR